MGWEIIDLPSPRGTTKFYLTRTIKVSMIYGRYEHEYYGRHTVIREYIRSVENGIPEKL